MYTERHPHQSLSTQVFCPLWRWLWLFLDGGWRRVCEEATLVPWSTAEIWPPSITHSTLPPHTVSTLSSALLASLFFSTYNRTRTRTVLARSCVLLARYSLLATRCSPRSLATVYCAWSCNHPYTCDTATLTSTFTECTSKYHMRESGRWVYHYLGRVVPRVALDCTVRTTVQRRGLTWYLIIYLE